MQRESDMKRKKFLVGQIVGTVDGFSGVIVSIRGVVDKSVTTSHRATNIEYTDGNGPHSEIVHVAVEGRGHRGYLGWQLEGSYEMPNQKDT